MPNYTLSVGKVYLGDAGSTGERYVGNSPGLSYNLDVKTLTTMKSVNGVVVPNKVFLLQAASTLTLQLDDVSNENLKLFFGSSGNLVESIALSSSVTITAHLGRLYEINRGGLLHVRAFKNNVEIDVGSNFDVDYDFGFVTPKTNPLDLYEGATVVLNFDAGRRVAPELGSTVQLFRGSMRYVERNIAGTNRMFYFPEVTATPDGSVDMKSATWRSFGIQMEVTSIPVILDQFGRDDYGMLLDETGSRVDFGNLHTTSPLFSDYYGALSNGR